MLLVDSIKCSIRPFWATPLLCGFHCFSTRSNCNSLWFCWDCLSSFGIESSKRKAWRIRCQLCGEEVQKRDVEKFMKCTLSVLPCQRHSATAFSKILRRPTWLIRQAPFRKVQSTRPDSKVFGRVFYFIHSLYIVCTCLYILLRQVLQQRRLEALAADGHVVVCTDSLSWHDSQFQFSSEELDWISISPVPRPIILIELNPVELLWSRTHKAF